VMPAFKDPTPPLLLDQGAPELARHPAAEPCAALSRWRLAW